ncbi:hypothetical protein FN846DRAFT_394100 [Sphaerosporella brunnea]|uniref:Uncharacterized protein n=1 Tax=Sphaerosporella brunnea TaxID=1250544 RepID=A0A5J5F590_9PEZI|nr:hypothetical protein FN846DRAFT_394100 [Sphaerosporella brunnea]
MGICSFTFSLLTHSWDTLGSWLYFFLHCCDAVCFFSLRCSMVRYFLHVRVHTVYCSDIFLSFTFVRYGAVYIHVCTDARVLASYMSLFKMTNLR